MDNINIKPEDIKNFSRQLANWSRDMKGISRDINRSSQLLSSRWKDSNFNAFLNVAITQGKSLDSSINQFDELAKQLSEMATDLQREHQKHQKRFR